MFFAASACSACSTGNKLRHVGLRPGRLRQTTLVASWLESRKLPSLWYRLDEGDADLATFFYYLGLAAKKAAPGTKNRCLS